jgi:hypothetical protein
MASGFGQSSFDPYKISSNDEECLKATNVAEMIPRLSNCTAYLSTTTGLYLNSLPEAPKTWG